MNKRCRFINVVDLLSNDMYLPTIIICCFKIHPKSRMTVQSTYALESFHEFDLLTDNKCILYIVHCTWLNIRWKWSFLTELHYWNCDLDNNTSALQWNIVQMMCICTVFSIQYINISAYSKHCLLFTVYIQCSRFESRLNFNILQNEYSKYVQQSLMPHFSWCMVHGPWFPVVRSNNLVHTYTINSQQIFWTMNGNSFHDFTNCIIGRGTTIFSSTTVYEYTVHS